MVGSDEENEAIKDRVQEKIDDNLEILNDEVTDIRDVY
jgi:hypothetical protein